MNGLAPTDAADALRAAEERIFAAIKAGDIASLESELAEDFVHSPLLGAEQDRSAFLRAIQDAPYHVLDIKGEGVRVRVLGDVAVLSGIQRARVALPDGQTVSAATAFVDLFVKSGAGWQLRHAVSVELPAVAGEQRGRILE